jgi:UDP-galactopyranose mutase
MYDYVIVGSGFFGSICAYELNKIGKKVLVIEKRNHIGGNSYTENRDNINLHIYGAHIFHTSNDEVWKWVNQFTSFNNFRLSPVANYKGEIFSLPFNMWTFSKLWGITTPDEARVIISSQSMGIEEPKNLEEQSIKLVGLEIYEKLIKGYTQKQWKKHPKELPPEIIKRLPVRFTYDNNYFNDKYQGIPIGGYTKIFDKLLEGIEVRLNVDYLEDKELFNSLSKKVIYTGPIDKFYNYSLGHLEYKTVDFKHKLFEIENYQGVHVMNYTDLSIPYTRTIEHKFFENSQSNSTWVTWEYPINYIPDSTEAYYPVNDKVNNELYLGYKEKSKDNPNIYFGGRLAEYKYYDMDKVIESALQFVQSIINQ